MDSLIFQAMAVEVKRRINNSRLDKVVQPTAGTLLLKFWTGHEKLQLLLKAEGKGAYYLTQEHYPAPARPPRLCQLLRARLRRLLDVFAEPQDRVVHFVFLGADDKKYDLVFEAIGAQSNLILVDDQGQIVDLLYRRKDQRPLLPGQPYQLPQQTHRIALLANIDEAAKALQDAERTNDAGFSQISPMTPILAAAIRHARAAGQSFDAILSRIRGSFQTGDFTAQRLIVNSHEGLMPLSLFDEPSPAEMYGSLSAMIEASLQNDDQDKTKDLAARMQTIISKQYKFLAKRKEKIAVESERQSNPEQFKIQGDLLLANLHKIKRGDTLVEVADYYQSPPQKVVIDLDGKLTPQQNAERYYKLYRKALRSREHHCRRLQETADELAWLEQLELSLEEASSAEDLYEVQIELSGAGLLKDTKGQLGKRRPERPEDQLHRAVSPAGWQVFWGKNSRTNDYVSKTMTSADDYWFHAKGMPGSHVVLKCGEAVNKVAEEDVLFAASLAAGYSKGKNDGKVEVIVAMGKDVKKPKGAKPGLVTVDSYRSVIVAPHRIDEPKE